MVDYIGRALVVDALKEWRGQLHDLATASPLRDLADSRASLIELTGTHPSGLAQLFASRPTHLTNIVRDSDHQAGALHRAGRMVKHVTEVVEATGVSPAALVVGVATWTENEIRRELPVLLRPIDIEAGPRDDATLTLHPAVEMNPVLGVELRRRGVQVSFGQSVASTMAGKTFDPRPLWNDVRECADAFGDDFVVEERLVVGVFDDPEQRLVDDLDECAQLISSSEVLAAVAGDQDAQGGLTLPMPGVGRGDRDPFAERGLGDLDDVQFAALDVVATGRSVFIQAPPGADVVSTAAAIVADAAASGRTAAVVSARHDSLAGVARVLDAVGAGELYVDGTLDDWNSVALAKLLAAMTMDDTFVNEDELRATGERLLVARSDLRQRFEGLHRRDEFWGVSAYEAVQALVRLTAGPHKPSTPARFGPEAQSLLTSHTLRNISDAVVAQLAPPEPVAVAEPMPAPEPAYLDPGAPTPPQGEPAADVWWAGAVATADEGAALDEALAMTVMRNVPHVLESIAEVSREIGLNEAGTIAQWRQQLHLCGELRSTLEIFSPAAFQRPLGDYVAATAAPGSASHVDMSRRERKTRVREAEALLRPGRPRDALHEQLKMAADQLLTWRAHATPGAVPKVPDELEDHALYFSQLEASLEVLAPVVEAISGVASLEELPWAELVATLEGLAQGASVPMDALVEPEVSAELAHVGLKSLLTDLRERSLTGDAARAETEFSWWASAFSALVSADPRLVEAGALTRAVAAFRETDDAFGWMRVEPLMRAVDERRRGGIARNPEAARDLFSGLVERRRSTYKDLWASAPALVGSLRPVVLAPAAQVPQVVPAERVLNTVVLIGMESMTLAELVPTLARASQVVMIADAHGATRSGVLHLAEVLPRVDLHGAPQPRDPRVTAVLRKYVYGEALAQLPSAGVGGSLDLVRVDAVGIPALGDIQVESTRAEVTTVTEHVLRIARSLPRRSCAVVAGTPLHAARIREALAEGFENMTAAPHVPVLLLGNAGGVEVDEVVIALGFARDTRGALPTSLGALAGDAGKRAIAQALLAARGDVCVVSALGSDQLRAIASAGGGGEGVFIAADLIDSASAKAPARTDDTERRVSDWLLEDVARRLRAEGFAVRVRHSTGGDSIPLAVGGRHDRGYRIAVVTDDTTIGPQQSLRDSVRLQTRRLEALGWKVISLWTIDIFMDPDAAAQQIRAALEPTEIPLSQEIPVVTAPEDDVTFPARTAAQVIAEESKAKPTTEKGLPQRKSDDEPLIPTRSADDSDEGWSEGFGGNARDDEMKRDKPPHW